MTDTERLDWLEKEMGIAGGGLISDDNGHWAVTADGFQNCTAGDEPADIQTTFFVEAGKWHKNLRDAIDAIMKEYAEDSEGA